MDVNLNGARMGSYLDQCNNRIFNIKVEAEDKIRAIELIKNGKVYKFLSVNSKEKLSDRKRIKFKLRLELGWGEWKAKV
ncbi:MAG: hypothetical protein ACOCP8_09505 [archaeon]